MQKKKIEGRECMDGRLKGEKQASLRVGSRPKVLVLVTEALMEVVVLGARGIGG